jgi:hypothetical protein
MTFCSPRQITSNTIGTVVTLANPVYYNETITTVGVSTLSSMSCCAYPQISFHVVRAGARVMGNNAK